MARALPSLIGVIHLPPLPGTPGRLPLEARGTPSDLLQYAGLWAVREAQLLQKAGFDGIFLENFGDIPFYKDKVPAETIAALAVIAAAVREATRLPIGINVLRNDARAALAIAAVTGCQFIRVNVLSGVAATDQGLVEGDAAGLLRERERLGADVAILADVHVKHGRSLSSPETVTGIELGVEEAFLRAGADGVIITGPTTGRSVDMEKLAVAGRHAKAMKAPLYIGSGSTPQTLAELRRHASGIIVGSAIRKEGRAGAPLDPARVRAFATAFKKAKKSGKSKRGK